MIGSADQAFRGFNRRDRVLANDSPLDAPPDLPLGDDELLSQKRVLRDELGVTPNKIRSEP